MWRLTTFKISVCLSFLNWIKNEFFSFFYRRPISELMLATLIHRYDKKKEKKKEKKIISFQEGETNRNFTGCQVPHFMIVLILPYINLLNLSWIIKCIFLRKMEPLSCTFCFIWTD